MKITKSLPRLEFAITPFRTLSLFDASTPLSQFPNPFRDGYVRLICHVARTHPWLDSSLRGRSGELYLCPEADGFGPVAVHKLNLLSHRVLQALLRRPLNNLGAYRRVYGPMRSDESNAQQCVLLLNEP